MKTHYSLFRWLVRFGSLAVIMILLAINAFAANSLTGYWKTLDDKTGRPSSIVLIYSVNNRLFAKIVKPIPLSGEPGLSICTKCRGSQHNAPIIGLVFMTDMQQVSPNTWSRGRVLDPRNGKAYQATLT